MAVHARPKSVYAPRYRSVIALLRRSREAAGLSQEELAQRLKRTRTYVTKCELGERRIDLLEWIDYCRACGVKPTAFLAKLRAPRQKRR
jgi:transcriptional regulator with XRE-family HTH domain